MLDKKLTDNEIVKALDICSKSTNGCSHSNYSCEDCYLNGQPMCSTVLLQDTLDLINHLQAENERLSNMASQKQGDLPNSTPQDVKGIYVDEDIIIINAQNGMMQILTPKDMYFTDNDGKWCSMRSLKGGMTVERS